jgi:hypothetical protein
MSASGSNYVYQNLVPLKRTSFVIESIKNAFMLV